MTPPPYRVNSRDLGTGWCGCQRPDWHEPGCLHQLDPDHRAVLSAALAVDPIPAPRLSPDDECALIVRIHVDAEYAHRLLVWYRERIERGAA